MTPAQHNAFPQGRWTNMKPDQKPIDAVATVERNEAVTIHQPQTVSLFRTDDPVEVVTKATAVASALRDVISKQGLISNISGKQYPKCEAWTLCGTMLGVFPVLCWSKPVDGGWEARVEAKTKDGSVVGAAEAECLRSEKNWAKRDDFALRSMAQTRATAKALRMPLGFIMTLAGYQPTPAEEMTFEKERPTTEREEYLGGDTDADASSSSHQDDLVLAKSTTKPRPDASEAQKEKLIQALEKEDGGACACEYFTAIGALLEGENLEALSLSFVPVTEKEMRELGEILAAFAIGDKATRASWMPKGDKSVSVPRDEGVGDWKFFPVPYGKNAGKLLGKLEANSLRWYVNTVEVKTSYVGKDGKTYQTKPEHLKRDKAFRAALDAARAELGIEKEEA